MNRTPWLLSLHWLWFVGLLTVGLVILWDNGILQLMIASDNTYLCLLILALLLLTTLHCGYRSLFLSRQSLSLLAWQAGLTAADGVLMNRYLRELRAIPNAHEKQLMAELLGEELRGQHQVGWFVAGLMIKLGLLGTVVGFVIMLGSMGHLESLDIRQVQILMEQMTQGMKIALNTTIVGLVASMLLGLQYLLLDRTADRLVVEAVHASESERLGAVDGTL